MAKPTIEICLPWKSVWVTGGGRGIGAALVELLCERGVNVYASSRTSEDLAALQRKLMHCPGKMIPVPLDIRDSDQINQLVDRWNDDDTFPDLVILNAGTHDPFSPHEFAAQRCRKLFDINLMGTMNCLEPVLKHFLANHCGQIAVMASVAGYRGLPTAAAYGASKAALIHLCEALELDLSGSGVKLQVINPGFVRTPLTDKNTFEMPCLMEPEDAARAIVKGLSTRKFEIVFPWVFVVYLKLLRLLPYRLYFSVVKKLTGKPNA